MNLFRKNLTAVRAIVLVIVWNFLLTILLPVQSVFAQSGPGQSETSGFSLNSTSNLVNKFTGDFSYSIPLMNVEGYPITISYNQNSSMTTEASWVGLGWDLNIGSVNRQMRGIPDDFNGRDQITKTSRTKEDKTDGWKAGAAFNVSAAFSSSSLRAGIGISTLGGKYKNSINGPGTTFDLSLSASISTTDDFRVDNVGLGLFGGIGFSGDSQNGVGRSGNLGLSGGLGGDYFDVSANAGFGSAFHSRHGITGRYFSLGAEAGVHGKSKEDEAKGPLGGGGTGTGVYLSVGEISTLPKIRNEMVAYNRNNNFALSGFLVQGVLRLALDLSFIDYLSVSKNKSFTTTANAFGYLHSAKRDIKVLLHPDAISLFKSENSVMDYNSSQAVMYNEEMKNLPFSAPTYDLFNISALGIQGQFRPHRSEIGTLKDAKADNVSTQKNAAIGAGIGGYYGTLAFSIDGGGGNGTSTQTTKSSGQISEYEYGGVDHNDLNAPNTNTMVTFNGENLLTEEEMFNDFKATTPISRRPFFDNTNKQMKYEGDHKFRDRSGLEFALSNPTATYRAANKTRAHNVRTVHASKAVQEGNSIFRDYDENEFAFMSPAYSIENRKVDGFRNGNHISMIEVDNTSGTHYVFGIPAYSIKNESVAFSADLGSSSQALFQNYGLAEYDDQDNSINNENGKIGFYEKNVTPAYAHSFLITEMYSSDYIDRTNNGPSLDDIGSYFKFNYSKVYGKSNPYTWRSPVSGLQSEGDTKVAFLDEGFQTSEVDDIAKYEYGEKEVWYVNSVESKNRVAQFFISDREDGYAVDEDGFIDDSKTLKKLDSIVLYNKADLQVNGTQNATPIQTVLFSYDYSLCKGAPNNINTYNGNDSTSGKLTLTEIRIKSGGSEETALYPYEFTYSSVNKDFNYINVDKWDNYKENNTALPNRLHPYVNQNIQDATESAQNWKLTKIKTPKNGEIEIAYEPDEYHYVQNKKAKRFYQLEGMTSMIDLTLLNEENLSSTEPELFNTMRALSSQASSLANLDAYTFPGLDNNSDGEQLPNNVLVFKLDEAYSSSGTNKQTLEQKLVDDYFTEFYGNQKKRLKEIYTKTKVAVDHNELDKKEVIPTFVNIGDKDVQKFNFALQNAIDDGDVSGVDLIKSIGLLGSESTSLYKYGYVVLALDNINDNTKESKKDEQDIFEKSDYLVSSLQKAAWQFSRRHLPDLIYADCEVNSNGEFECDYKNNIDWRVAFGGKLNKVLNKKKFCLEFDPSQSFIRLNNVSRYARFSSTARVKSITYTDNWSAIANSVEPTSSYTWEYHYKGTTVDKNKGVAANEPAMGKDENPLYQWSTYTNEIEGSAMPDMTLYNEEPVASALFPAPVIGYEKVEVKFAENNAANKVGTSISTYHTAKEHPTQILRTHVSDEKEVYREDFFSSTYSLVALAQGYVLIKNDFHGKQKGSKIYDASESLVSSTTYEYWEEEDKLKYLDREGNTHEKTSPFDYEMYFTTGISHRAVESLQWNISAYGIFGPPYFMLGGGIRKLYQETGMMTNVFHKLVQRYARVKSVKTKYLGSNNSAENLYYDMYTGNVLVSSLKDEYNDKLFSVNYPAHWYYENFQNIHRPTQRFQNITITDGEIVNPTPGMLASLSEGDILLCNDGSSTSNATLLEKTDQSITLIKPGIGSQFNTGSDQYDITVQSTGRKNRLGTIMQSVTTKDDSFLDNGFDFPSQNIISVNAIAFKENKNVYCGGVNGLFREPGPDSGDVIDPYTNGVKGIYRIATPFAFQQERDHTDPHNTRHSGALTNYASFYELVNGVWNKVNDADHPNYVSPYDYDSYRMLGDLTEHDEFGKPIESQDQIDVFSASIYGYSNTAKLIPIAQATNARQTEIAFDGFEDYDYLVGSTTSGHFDFNESVNSGTAVIDDSERHSGNSSLYISSANAPTVARKVDNVDPCDPVTTPNIEAGEYKVRDCDCVEDFSPTPGKYVVSLWVKEENPTNDTTYSNTIINLLNLDSGGSTISSNVFSPSGPIIDGWQRIEGIFEISSNTDELLIKFSADVGAYIDDIRIHPFKSSMVTMVYDKKTLLPLARHDAYNFTTFYNYDRNLQIRKVRVETYEGIRTVTESESGSEKRYAN